jgi:hypothetical protein
VTPAPDGGMSSQNMVAPTGMPPACHAVYLIRAPVCQTIFFVKNQQLIFFQAQGRFQENG